MKVLSVIGSHNANGFCQGITMSIFSSKSIVSPFLKMSCSDATSPISKSAGIINLMSSFDLRSKYLFSTTRFSPLTIKATASTNNRSLPKIDILVLMAAPFLSVNRKELNTGLAQRMVWRLEASSPSPFTIKGAASSDTPAGTVTSNEYSSFTVISVAVTPPGKITSFTDSTSVPTTVRLIPSITIEG